MKKILTVVILAAFLVMPTFAFAKQIIADSELDAISAQVGSITTDMTATIFLKSRQLKSIATDGWNYWDSDHRYGDPHNSNADGYFDGSSNKNVGFGEYNQPGYIGYTEAYLTGGYIKRSGYMTTEVFPTMDPDKKSYVIKATMKDQSLDTGDVAVDFVVKLGKNTDLSDDQPALGRVHTQGIANTMNGSLTVYAHNNSFFD